MPGCTKRSRALIHRSPRVILPPHKLQSAERSHTHSNYLQLAFFEVRAVLQHLLTKHRSGCAHRFVMFGVCQASRWRQHSRTGHQRGRREEYLFMHVGRRDHWHEGMARWCQRWCACKGERRFAENAGCVGRAGPWANSVKIEDTESWVCDGRARHH